MKIIHGALCGLLLALLAPSQAATPEDMARQWCASCHNADGNSSSPLIPRLAGQQAGYLAQQLQAMKEHSRSDQSAHDFMWRSGSTLDDAAIAGLSDYFFGQKAAANTAAVDAAQAAAGDRIFHNGIDGKGTSACATCHGQRGEGSESGPRLAAQHAAYVARQLHAFAGSQRPAAAEMQAIVKTLKDEEINALAAYIQTLH
ncbi:c-type cytochrome [Vogesella sp. LIG4]|uniref:c-type cytochrome n=1 Tax=Vogesella sp. LIG4 TaxID=1192162 RepID=UPI00081F822F|nr:c-type cytochrome [Vogesella sp. LIG4]SCK19854.1 Cytochrome c553 [Vogesella sp. LIG4]